MPHAFVMALFSDDASAAAAARDLRALGIPRERVSIVAKSHDIEGSVTDAAGASPGSEIDHSNAASRLGELAAHVAAVVSVVIPGAGPIVADGPLAAEFGDAAGHAAGDISRALERAGLEDAEARRWEKHIEGGAFLVGAHIDPRVDQPPVEAARDVLIRHGGSPAAVGSWKDA
jgi:hypothetical protein